MLDLLIKNANLFQHKGRYDLGLSEGEITYKKPGDKSRRIKAKKEINAEQKLVIPGFIDSHTHLDKSHTRNEITNKSGTLKEAINNYNKNYDNVSQDEIYERELKTIKMAVKNGSTVIRTHLTLTPENGFKGMEPMLKLKEELKDIVTIQIVAFPGSPSVITKEMEEILKESLERGVDLIGGCPHLSDDYKESTDKLFDIAREYDVDIDFHVDESDEADVRALEYLAEKTIAENYEGRVTAGHCTSLSVVDDTTAKRVMKKVKKANINIITLPSCNLYLMGRNGGYPIRRGVTRVKEFLDIGVNIAYASDNIRDPFRPFGNGDMLEEGLFTAQVIQYGTPQELEKIIEMGTYNPAKALGLKKYGLDIGDRADLVIVDATNPAEALLSGSQKSYVIKKGKIVAINSKKSEIIY